MKLTTPPHGPALRRDEARGSACPAPATPYRTPAGRVEDQSSPEEPFLGAFAILLLASGIRLVPACMGQEAFGTEPTLALFAVASSGYELGRAALAWLRGRRPDHGA
ncbi:MAG: hypothetical protein IT372_33065 [Polyangiaceae bacterium]|nr:hypothetical protein [Polyangiaceae bacterium]